LVAGIFESPLSPFVRADTPKISKNPKFFFLHQEVRTSASEETPLPYLQNFCTEQTPLFLTAEVSFIDGRLRISRFAASFHTDHLFGV